MTDLLVLLSFGNTGWGDEIARGVLVTASLALATVPFGLVLGLLLALAKRGEDRALALSADIYTTLFRGLPELLTLFLVYYGGQNILNSLTDALGYGQLALSSFASGMFALGLV